MGISKNSVISKKYSSGNQTITAAGLLTLAHGLGVKPKLLQACLVCVVADIGFLVNDEVALNMCDNGGGAAGTGQDITCDETNVYVRFGGAAASYKLLNKTTGAFIAITANTSWRLKIEAWA